MAPILTLVQIFIFDNVNEPDDLAGEARYKLNLSIFRWQAGCLSVRPSIVGSPGGTLSKQTLPCLPKTRCG
ncbi:MAG: hypothetical protein DRR06_10950 [Gammaproteobacteria bacterium]|nr:MAG: hypothetical protein DRR06_10950 [Gammaproteobacteria bacterium]RLA51027.1 MAG: hypothetical protein DRR42_11445 [Gammaproteobacteria bacterium]